MKKRLIAMAAASVVLFLSACGGNASSSVPVESKEGTSSVGEKEASSTLESRMETQDSMGVDISQEQKYSVEELSGKWVSDETDQILTISEKGASLFTYGKVALTEASLPGSITGDVVDFSDCGKYTVEEEKDSLRLICVEAKDVAKDTAFVKEDTKYTDEQIFINWMDVKSGDSIICKADQVLLNGANGKSKSIPRSLVLYTNRKLYIKDICVLDILDGGKSIKLKDNDHEYITEKEAEEIRRKNKEKYKKVINVISKNPWVFNGGEDTILNYLEFSENKVKVGQVYFDGNGVHDNGASNCSYEISKSMIDITLSNGEKLSIAYKKSGEKYVLGKGEYMSLDEVEEKLQGYWRCRYTDIILGKECIGEVNLFIDHGTMQSERASLASGNSGEYYYYGPYSGTYRIGIGRFDTDMSHGREWFYNIIDGVPTILYYDHKCERGSGFPGQYGYSF